MKKMANMDSCTRPLHCCANRETRQSAENYSDFLPHLTEQQTKSLHKHRILPLSSMDPITGKEGGRSGERRRRNRNLFRVLVFVFMVCLICYHKCRCCRDQLSCVTRTASCSNLTKKEIKKTEPVSRGRERKSLRGLGSSPPRCISRCGKCSPCKPVHVMVPPGTLALMEYYPEAWRCRCGNRIYMP